MSKRVVITGTGVISSLGFSLSEIISNFKKKRVNFIYPEFNRNIVVSPVRDFDIISVTGKFKERKYLNRGAQFITAAAFMAAKDADLNRSMLNRAGLFLGTGPNLDIGGEFYSAGNGHIDKQNLLALWMLRFLPNTPASIIAKLLDIHGENSTINTACTASLQAIGEGFRRVKDGRADIVLAGGGDSRINHGAVLGYDMAQALYSGKGDPLKAVRPFDMKRSGFVSGEGAAVFVIEEFEHAKKRGADILGEICGFGTSLDGYSMTAPDPCGRWAALAIESALSEAVINRDQIDLIFAHGTSTPVNDKTEADLIARVFCHNPPYVTAIKSWIGHLAAGCGAVELAAGLSIIKHKYVPEIRNLNKACNKKVNFIKEPFDFTSKFMLIENFGFGGQNCVLVVKNIV